MAGRALVGSEVDRLLRQQRVGRNGRGDVPALTGAELDRTRREERVAGPRLDGALGCPELDAAFEVRARSPCEPVAVS